MQFRMALSDAFLDTVIYFPPKGVCLESKMADEQAMIRRLLNNSLVSIIRELASEILVSDRIDSLYYRIDWLYHTTVRYLDTGIIDARIVRCLREAKDCLYRSRSRSLSTSLQAQKTFTGERGRPVFDIPKEQLEFLTEKKFTVGEMAQLFGVSKRTLERRLSEFGLRVRANYARLTDAELDATVNDIIADFPNVGCKRMSGLLLGRGLRIQQSRIRECMRRVNPEGVLLRALELRLIQRRSYYVQGPLSLWHIDGNHKLIR